MRKSTKCWSCSNTCGGCSWTRDFKPVEGWEAEKIKIKNNFYIEESYIVTDCPQYKPLFKFRESKHFKFDDYCRFKEFGEYLKLDQRVFVKNLLTKDMQQLTALYKRSERTLVRRISQVRQDLKTLEEAEAS